jgi:hypothetical protein
MNHYQQQEVFVLELFRDSGKYNWNGKSWSQEKTRFISVQKHYAKRYRKLSESGRFIFVKTSIFRGQVDAACIFTGVTAMITKARGCKLIIKYQTFLIKNTVFSCNFITNYSFQMSFKLNWATAISFSRLTFFSFFFFFFSVFPEIRSY